MRYNNWDVLLFAEAGETKTPLQEFKTTCDVVQDPSAEQRSLSTNPGYFNTVTRPVATVSCYVPSLPHGFPFRVSLHSWTAPVASTATTSMASHDNLIGFEAKVLIDGICVAGIVFDKEASWPQIVDMTSHVDKEGKHDQLRFPPFHTEMLTQAWVNPAQTMGRIKIMIAEGVQDQAPGPSTRFEKTRDIVAFSFQHTPLHILEDTGIAWPNPGMWYQSVHQNFNPLSPRKIKETNPDSHAHSPRHISGTSPKIRPRMDSASAPSSMSHGLLKAPPAFRQPLHNGDPFLPQYATSSHDPFVEGSTPSAFRKPKRIISGSGDISMPDHTRSHASSSSHDQSMPDYSRPLSPISSRSYPMPDYSRPLTPTSHRSHSASVPTNSRPRSPVSNRQASEHEMAQHNGAHLTRDGLPCEDQEREDVLGSQGPVWHEYENQFSEMMASFSPRKVATSGTSAPANTRVSSAANTPPAATRPSAAAEARASSYNGMTRSMSETQQDPPATSASRANSGASVKPCPDSRKSSTRQSEIHEEPTPKAHSNVKKKPSGNVKSRKEGRTSEAGVDPPTKSQRRLSAEVCGSNDKENKESSDGQRASGGDNKRRRISGNFDAGLGIRISQDSRDPATKNTVTHEVKEDAPADAVDIDELTEEGVVLRAPLRHLDNLV